MDSIRPPRLKMGDTIGLVAPSKSARHVSETTWRRGVTRLHNKGFELVEGKALRGSYGHTGDTIRERVDDLERMFRRDDILAIMAVVGGSSAHQLLEYLDYDLIRRHPKILIGFSDTTALAVGIHQQTGLVTFAGPSFLTFCQPEFAEYTELYFDQVITEASRTVRLKPAEVWADDAWWEKPYPVGRQWQEGLGWTVLRSGRATGKSLVANLETLVLLAGTPYWPDFSGTILFLESCDKETPASVDRYLTLLRQVGVFKQIAGLVFGRFPRKVAFVETDSLTMILEEALRGTNFPIISEVEFGHTDPIATLPLGVSCQMDTTKKEIVFTEAAVI